MTHVKKPEWLKISIGANSRYSETKKLLIPTNYTPYAAADDARTWANAGVKVPLLS